MRGIRGGATARIPLVRLPNKGGYMAESFAFSKVIPGGNPTIIIHASGDAQQAFSSPLGLVAARLMDPMHIGAEQVGVLCVGGEPYLEMMGGEFCVNATRAAAVLLALDGLLAEKDGALRGEIRVSGSTSPVPVVVCRNAQEVEAAEQGAGGKAVGQEPQGLQQSDLLAPYSAALMACDGQSLQVSREERGATLVRMPGMSHLLLDAAIHPFPGVEKPGWQKAAFAWRTKLGLLEEDASGVVWYEGGAEPGGAPARGESADAPRVMSIHPAVYVRASQSEHLETACGSATLALAAMLRDKDGKLPRLSVMQPGGQSLDVIPAGSTGAWVGSRVVVAARGTAYLPSPVPPAS